MSPSTPDDPGPGHRPHGVHGGGDRYEALLDVLEQQADLARRGDPSGRGSGRGARMLVIALAVITAWVWILPPRWLVPVPPPAQTVAEEDAALRFAVYVQAQRIRAYQLERGFLPESLDEAGDPLPGLRYMVLGPGLYELTASTDRQRLTYRSDEPLREWVGPGTLLDR